MKIVVFCQLHRLKLITLDIAYVMFIVFLLCIIFFSPWTKEWKITRTYIRRDYFWTEIRCSQWYKRRRIWNIIRAYLQQKMFLLNSFCMHIAQFFPFHKKEEVNEIQCSIKISFYSSLQKIFIFLDSFEQI